MDSLYTFLFAEMHSPNMVFIEENIEEVFDGLVMPLGNGAIVIASKKYIGKKAYVITRISR